MKITFSKEIYNLLREKSKKEGISIPRLLEYIVRDYYKVSQKGENNGSKDSEEGQTG